MASVNETVSGNADKYYSDLKAQMDAFAGILNTQAQFDIVSSGYTGNLENISKTLTDMSTKQGTVNDKWSPPIKDGIKKAVLKEQGKIGSLVLDDLDEYEQRIKDYTPDLVDPKDKNLDGFKFDDPTDYSQPLWTNYDVSNGDILSPVTAPYVTLQTYIDYVFLEEFSDKQEMIDNIDAGNAAVCARGFTFPNSSASSNTQIILMKYLKAINDRARKIWEDIATKINSYIEQAINNALDRLNSDLDFNKQRLQLSKQIADAYAQLQGIMNDININKFTLTEQQEQQYLKNMVTIFNTIYRNYITTESTIFETHSQTILAKWEKEVLRVKAEMDAAHGNISMHESEMSFYNKQYDSKLKAAYQGLSADISAYQGSFEANLRALGVGFEQLIQTMRSATQSVVSLVSGKE